MLFYVKYGEGTALVSVPQLSFPERSFPCNNDVKCNILMDWLPRAVLEQMTKELNTEVFSLQQHLDSANAKLKEYNDRIASDPSVKASIPDFDSIANKQKLLAARLTKANECIAQFGSSGLSTSTYDLGDPKSGKPLLIREKQGKYASEFLLPNERYPLIRCVPSDNPKTQAAPIPISFSLPPLTEMNAGGQPIKGKK